MSFKGKNIIVTGATGDLGTAITQRLISQGANVLAVGSRAAGFPRLVAACSGPGLLETIGRRRERFETGARVRQARVRSLGSDRWLREQRWNSNAGTSDRRLPRGRLRSRDGRQCPRMFLGLKHVFASHAGRRFGGQHVERAGLGGRRGHLRLRHVQARHHRPNQNRRARTGARNGACQCLLSRSRCWKNDIQAGRRGVRGQATRPLPRRSVGSPRAPRKT